MTETKSSVRYAHELTKFSAPNGENVEEVFGAAKAKITIVPGGKSRLHYHPECEESYFILSGKGRVVLDGKEHIIGPGDSVAIVPKTNHQIFNFHEKDGEPDLTFIAVCAAPWTPTCSVFLD